nr:metal-sensing transcriptional repressor [Anoxybacter fermentans]
MVHPNTKRVIYRLARIAGHTNAIKKMVEEGRDCSEILIQIAAVKSALNNVGKLILKDHINHCVVKAIEENNTEILEDLQDAIDKFVK